MTILTALAVDSLNTACALCYCALIRKLGRLLSCLTELTLRTALWVFLRLATMRYIRVGAVAANVVILTGLGTAFILRRPLVMLGLSVILVLSVMMESRYGLVSGIRGY